ncbi:EF-hand calcium-binding domain-containing protein 7 isoform X2 [Xyrauchen texanus]|uniref:EF-hand calcium-binding domain-containing protein 7 isoform X2 n=1 Tax=Xyrauchen texanus TaxID=154827 RepID=UPI002241A3AA|nr:EF-hand calcium-binding domain-containing protein 7 isoform X2 [Xyrauchen texanus]
MQRSEEERFYIQCRAAYLSVFRSSLMNMTSKDQLCTVLQQAGRNPSQKALDKYWPPGTKKLNFDDFCDILKKEKPAEADQLMRIFKKFDVNCDGYISHDELSRILTSTGEKMSPKEVDEIFSLADVNKDGKLDYAEFCRLLGSTVEQCQAAAHEKLESDAKLKRQNFGNQLDKPLQSPETLPELPASETHPRAEMETTHRKDSRTSSRPSSARSRRSSLSTTITMGTGSIKSGRLTEPKSLQNWHHNFMRGCFYVEEDGTIVSLQYRLHIPETTSVYLTIRPCNLSLIPEKPSPWMCVDTALYVVTGNETKEDTNLVCFTELRDKERFVWRGELNAGSFLLFPFTTGCRLMKRTRKTTSKTAQLVNRTQSGELELTKEFKAALSDIFEVIDLDGNGLLSLEEYNFFEQRTSGEKCDEDAWAICKENFDTKNNELTRQGFLELNLMEANDREGDPRDLGLTLEAMGYNCSLEMVEACPFVIDVYCEKVKANLQAVNLDSGIKMLNSAVQRSISSKAEAKSLKGHESVLVYTYKGESRISSVIANKSNQKVTVHINNEQSKNCVSSRGMSVFAVEVPARTKMVCQHVMALNDQQEWTYNCIESIIPSL